MEVRLGTLGIVWQRDYNQSMFKKKSPQDLSVTELRRLLVDRRRSERSERLNRFRETGRVVTLVSDETSTWEDMRTETIKEECEIGGQSKQRGRRAIDGLLFAVEILAVVGLVFVLFNGLDILKQLNEEVAIALEQPTLTPTPLIKAVVLPSGHTSPSLKGGSRPNVEEIPEHLRALQASYAEIPAPVATPGPKQAIRIQIPAIGKDAPVVEGDGWEQLKKGVGHHIGSANPGQPGNVVLSAHNDIYGEIFRYLDKLVPGDEIILFSEQESYTYLVTQVVVVEPTQVEFMEATADPTVTLISCYPYLIDKKRIVVIGKLATE